MDRTTDEPSHRAVVDAWLARSVEHGSSSEIVGMFGAAFEGLWSHAVTTLGSVTLTAIAERVLVTSTGRYPSLSVINLRPNGDSRWRQHLYERLSAAPRLDLLAGLRFALIELLTVIGRLTAEILTEDLHAAIIAVTAAAPAAKPPAAGHTAPAIATGPVAAGKLPS